MQTDTTEIADGVYRLSTYLEPPGLVFNQFLLTAEDHFGATCLTPATAPTIRSPTALRPTTLGLMHGPAYTGNCDKALDELAEAFNRRLSTTGPRLAEPRLPGQ